MHLTGEERETPSSPPDLYLLKLVIRTKAALFLRRTIADLKENGASHLVVYILGLAFALRILSDLYLAYQRLLRSIIEPNLTLFIPLEICGFLLFWLVLALFLVHRSFCHSDTCLLMFPIPDRVILSYEFIRILSPILLLDIPFFWLNASLMSPILIPLILSIQLLILCSAFFIIGRFWRLGVASEKTVALFLFGLLATTLTALYHIGREFILRPAGLASDFSHFVVMGPFGQERGRFFLPAIILTTICISCLFYRKAKHSFNPLNTEIMAKRGVGKPTVRLPKGRHRRESIELRIRTYRLDFGFFVAKDIRLLKREVGTRLLVVCMISMMPPLFGLDIIKSGKLALGEIATVGILSYAFILFSMIIAVPGVGGESRNMGFIRNVMNLDRYLYGKICASFVASACLGMLIMAFLVGVMKYRGLFEIKFAILVFINILEYSLAHSLSGVLIGSYYANFSNDTGDRLKNVRFPGWILYFIIGIIITAMLLSASALFFVGTIYFVIALIVFNILLILISLAVIKNARFHLFKRDV